MLNINRIRQATITGGIVTVLVLLPIQVSLAQQRVNPLIDVSGHLYVRAVEGNFAASSNSFVCFLNDNAQLRVEYRLAEGSSNDAIILQTAIAF